MAEATTLPEATSIIVEGEPATAVAETGGEASPSSPEATVGPPVEPSATAVVSSGEVGEISATPGGGVEATSSISVPTPVAATPIQIIPAARPTSSNTDRWREQEVNRQPFPSPVVYTTSGSDLMWYDPVYQQPVLLGSFRGDFDVLATFQLRSSDQQALEVLYEVNKRYGLTALSPAVVERIKAAGYESGFIDTYVIVDDHVQPK